MLYLFEPLFVYLEAKSSMRLTEGQRITIQEHFQYRKLRKKQYFLQEGDICKYMGFVLKGSSRMYSIDDKGHEHILRFGLPSWWIGDFESYMLSTPSGFHIEMLEDAELLAVTHDHIQELIDTIPAVAEMIKAIDKQSSISTQKRIHAAISLTAEERYDNLLQTYPEFLQRFPQNMIASYLGISPETLSRIKKNSLHR